MRSLFSKEPAVVLGAVASVLAAFSEQVAASGASWRSLWPVVVSFVVRQFVSPAKAV